MKTNIINNTNFAIIACYTGEYCTAKFNYCSEDGPNFPDNPAWAILQSNEEAFNNLWDEGYDCIVAIPINKLQDYFDSIFKSVKSTFDFAFTHDGHLGDDTFYDYLPDAQLMLSQIAHHIIQNSDSSQDLTFKKLIKPSFEKLLKPFKLLVEQYDATFAKDNDCELLIDQLYTNSEIIDTIQTLNQY